MFKNKHFFAVGIFVSIFLILWPVQMGMGACPQPDLSGDCQVDIDDLVLFADYWLDPAGSLGDFTGNDGVDIADFAMLADNWLVVDYSVIINEIHYNPDLAQELVEFVELYNSSTRPVDLSGWRFTKGITYTFPAGTTIAAGGYLVVAEDPTPAVTDVTVSGKYGISASLVKGPFTGNISNNGETINLCDAGGQDVDEVNYQLGFPWPTVGDAVPDDGSHPGTGHSIQLVNPSFDNDLGGNWRSAYPTPGAKNTAVYAANIAPCIRQVEHSPMQPRAGQEVTITAKITDPDGVANVTLYCQYVNAGSYIRKTDAAYSNISATFTMRDNGSSGDITAGDSIYTAVIPANVQQHRRLVRYKINAGDNGGQSLTVPYADDPQAHFAYFVYNGVGAWSGANQPGSSPVKQFSQEVMQSLPAYHLIANETDVTNCQYVSGYEETRFWGTMIYDGIVYDNIKFQIRGEYSTYVSGKNKWKVFLNRGHDFQARDNYGEKYKAKWKTINLAACASPWIVANRGMAGIDEASAFALYRLAGIPSPNNTFLQLRIIDNASEASPTSQYEGDLWGLYMTIENPDGRFLDQWDFPDGNTYKMEGGGDKKNQGSTQSVDNADIDTFMAGYKQTNPVQPVNWWKANVNLEGYFSFRAINRAVNNMDLREGWNTYYYHHPVIAGNPQSSLWTVIPWDLDMVYCPASHWPGVIDIQNCLEHSEFSIAYKNRGRELQDLLLNIDQAGQIVNELAAVVNPPNQPLTMADVDQYMWNYHPRASTSNVIHRGAFYSNPAYLSTFNTPTYSRTLVWADHEGMMQWIKDFLTPTPGGGSTHTSTWVHRNGWEFLDSEVADSSIPNTPVITYQGAAGYPINDLKFQTSSFGDPQGAGTFAALKWRIAEVEPFSVYTPPASTQTLISTSGSWKYFLGSSEPPTTWKQKTFNDGSWSSGPAPLGYGVSSPAIATSLAAMQGNYTTVYFRTTFDINDPSSVTSLSLAVSYDEGFNVWINGTFVDSVNSPGPDAPYTAISSSGIYPGYGTQTRSLSNPSGYLTAGTNVIAVQLLNYSSGSSDILWAPMLTAYFGNSGGNPVSAKLVKPGKYEVTTLWESPEITSLSDLTMRIPASVVKVAKTYRVRSRMKDNTGRWSHWSAPLQFTTGQPLSAGINDNLRVTELMYNPAAANTAKGELNVDSDEFEYIELKNVGDVTLNLTNVSIVNGVTFSFADSAITSLAPGQFVLVVRNTAAFNSRYPGLSGRIAGQYTGKFDNAGEDVELADYYWGTIADFEYNDGYGWPIPADGAGHSMIPLDSALFGEPSGSLRYGGNWRASAYINGSPGADDPAPLSSIVINEVMAHTDFSNSSYPDYDSNDWIELYNPTGSNIAYDGNWYLSDTPDNLKKWALPSGSLTAGGWVSFDEISGFHSPITSGFGLDKVGEYVLLSYLPETGNARVADYVKFGGQYNTVSTGRYPDGGAYWFFLANPGTWNTANASPVQRPVVISEIMYNPLNGTTTEEYIELSNTSASSAVNLYNAFGTWRLDNAVTYVFPAGKNIPANGRIVVVSFDPAVETTRLAAFNTAYGCSLVANSTIFGPWTGDLSNSGERIALQEPQEADPPQTPATWWIITDQVIYGDYSPWPTSPDGTGAALLRSSSAASTSGDNPANWTAGSPTPGY